MTFGECALVCLAEVHDLLDCNRHFYKKLSPFQHVVGPAQPSEDSVKGNYGGTSVSVAHHIQWSPLSCSQFDPSKKVWRHEKCHAFSSVLNVKFHNIGGILVFYLLMLLFSGFEIDSVFFIGIFLFIQLSFITTLVFNLMHRVQKLEKRAEVMENHSTGSK